MSDPFPSAAPDFNDPLGLLRACHGRILRHCETLERLAEHLKSNGADSDARKAAGQVHRYFSTAGRHHHEDEEQDLFPFLAQQSIKLATVVHELKQEHRRMDALWQELAPRLEKLGQQVDDIDAFTAVAADFCAAYREHIAKENERLLDVAQHIFSNAQLKKLGNAMAARRGQQPAL